MSRLICIITVFIAFSFVSAPVVAQDVYVNGYTRSDGTYVRPHVRSAPDGIRSNNYGASQNDSQLMQPRTRDYDRDGTPNYQDNDDDNDGSSDNNDSSQYGSGW